MSVQKAAIVGGEYQFKPMPWYVRLYVRLNHRWLIFLYHHSKTLAWFWVKKEARRQLWQARDCATGTAVEIRRDLIRIWAEEWARFGLHSKTWYELQLRVVLRSLRPRIYATRDIR